MDTLDISLPTSWAALDDRQLLFAFQQIARQLPTEQVKAVCLFHWSGLKVFAMNGKHRCIVRHGKRTATLTARQVEAATHTLDFLDTIPPTPVRIERIPQRILHSSLFTLLLNKLHTPHFTLHTKRASALPADFQGVEFEKYLFLDNLYQGYLHTKDENLLHQMAQVLYQSDKVRPTQAHLIGCFYWFASLKSLFAREFPHFLQPINDVIAQQNTSHSTLHPSLYSQLKEATNAQIRALTGGDITKETTIKKLDTWRALTELDAKAKESEELARIYKK